MATVIESANDFKALFKRSATEHVLLLCLNEDEDGRPVGPAEADPAVPKDDDADDDGDAVTVDGTGRFQSVASSSREFSLPLYLWNCRGLPDAQRSLDVTVFPTLLVIKRDAVLDKLVGSKSVNADCNEFCRRIRATTVASTTESEDGAAGVTVDVARMLAMGKDLMSKSTPAYAEKFFLKALGVLDAVSAERGSFVASDDDFQASVALCLAWVVLAQLVQGKSANNNVFAQRLAADELFRYTRTPLSDELRSITACALFNFAPRTWTGDSTCSRKTLGALLERAPQDHASRAMLVVTHFLSGDIERCVTEALKLHALGQDFGRVALDGVCVFLGADHDLVLRCGWHVPKE